MKCPRCDGHLLSEDEDQSCLNCGYLDVALPEPPVDIEVWRRRAARAGGKSRVRRKPMPQGYGSNRPGVCFKGHGFRSLEHRRCMADRKAVLA